jgi:hypothetical protein
VGHYERWPECPDLLRKWWKTSIELPYLSIQSLFHFQDLNLLSNNNNNNQFETSFFAKKIASKHSTDTAAVSSYNYPPSHHSVAPFLSWFPNKDYVFAFLGHMELPGPEMVCSTRNNLYNAFYERNDVLFINLTHADAYYRPVISQPIANIISKSLFCLITAGDSYSTSYFYHAIAEQCIPIVINNWMTFSFPSIIPYDQFVIRIDENDFNKNPRFVLQILLQHLQLHQLYHLPLPPPPSPSPPRSLPRSPVIIASIKKIIRMQEIMLFFYEKYLSFVRSDYATLDYHQLMSADYYYNNNNDPSADRTTQQYTIITFELFLSELRYHYYDNNNEEDALTGRYYNSIPCLRPLLCTPLPLTNRTLTHLLSTSTKSSKSSVYSTDDLLAAYSYPYLRPAVKQGRTVLPAIYRQSYQLQDQQLRVRYAAVYSRIQTRLQSRYRSNYHIYGMIDKDKDTVDHIKDDNDNKDGDEYDNLPVVADEFQVHCLFVPWTTSDHHLLSNNSHNHNHTIADDGDGDSRSHLCQYKARLIGIYKIVYYMQCVRVLWTLQPGLFKPRDNLSITKEEYDYILAFHNLSRPLHWFKDNFPLAGKHTSYYTNNETAVYWQRKYLQDKKRVYTLMDFL